MIIPTGYAQANFQYTGADIPSGAEWTMGFDISGYSGGPADLADDCVIAYNADDLSQFHTAGVSLTSVLVKFGPNNTGPSGEAPATSAGTAAGNTCPPQVTALVRKLTAAGGRAGRGRLYFPGVPEGQVSGAGILSNAWITNLPAAMAATMALLDAGGAVPVLLHAAGSPIATPTPITGFTVAAQCATQRRRNRPD